MKLLKVTPKKYLTQRPPLPHPARPLHVHRAEAALLEVPDLRAVRIPGAQEFAKLAPGPVKKVLPKAR
jgi:hypothetical protein